MEFKLGFIGAGNMGGAMLRAAAKSVDPKKIAVFDADPAQLKKTQAEVGVIGVSGAAEIAEKCEYIVIAVKPHIVESVCKEMAPVLKKRKDDFTIITMAAGVTIEKFRSYIGKDYRIIRIMPNTPALVGEGMIVYFGSENVTEEHFNEFLDMFKAAGKFDKTEERLVDAIACTSGSGPAFVCMFAEALADGVVACGVPRKKALEYTAQMIYGTAKMIMETGDHPELLKDNVCSPGGTTIQGVRMLEKGGMRSSVIEAVIATYDKTSKLVK